jgi:hypothetical protein
VWWAPDDDMALRRLYVLERRFTKDSALKEAYTDFIVEYEQLGHMEPSTEIDAPAIKEYFLPHHAFVKPESSTTELRVVFDGSAASSTGLSLNDCLRVGPTIQRDLLDIYYGSGSIDSPSPLMLEKCTDKYWSPKINVVYSKFFGEPMPPFVSRYMYMCPSGSDTLEGAQRLQTQLI